MHIVILGAGVVGLQIAQHLIDEKKDVVLIEKDPERARYVSNHLDCIVLNEEGNSRVTLKRAGIARADFFISVTNSDEVNLIACSIVASEFPGPVNIARVRNLEYSSQGVVNRAFLGVDHIVNSEVETARTLFESIQHGAMGSILTFNQTDLQMRSFVIGPGSFFANMSLIEMKKHIKEQFLVAGIYRDEHFIIPSGDNILRENDTVYCMSRKETFETIFKQFEDSRKKKKKIQKMVLVGGGRIGALLCTYLEGSGLDITLIEKDYDKCKSLAERFPEIMVIHGDISEKEIFDELQLDQYDLIATTTNNQEMNILASAYARSVGTRRTMALVTKSNYLTVAGNLGIDVTISPKNSTVDAVLKYIRRGNIKSVHSLFEGDAEVIEFNLDPESSLSGKKLMDLDFPPQSLIITVVREGIDLIPDGQFTLYEEDTVIAIAMKESIPQLEEIFSR